MTLERPPLVEKKLVLNNYQDPAPTMSSINRSSSKSLSTMKVSPRPKHNPYSMLETMPDKQRKQIEYIDEMWNIYMKPSVSPSLDYYNY